MHVCSGFLQNRLKSAAVPGYRVTGSGPRRSQHSKETCRRNLKAIAKAAAKSKSQETSAPQGIASIDDAKQALESLLGKDSSALEAIQQAELAVEEGSLDESVLTSMVAMASEVQELASKSGGETSQVEKAESQAKAANEKYLRLNADFDNFRKRSANEREQLGDRTRGDVIKKLIPLVDSFEAAQTSVSAETENEKKINGAYQGIYKQMVEVFKGLGVEAVPGVGQPFDPNVHEAIMREPNESMPDGSVLQEFRRGFRLGKTLLRPGMVKVSYTEEPAQSSNNAADEEEVAEEPAIDVEVNEAN